MQQKFFNLDDYELVRELGRGGMAVVYEAIETSVTRRVAVKILPPAAALDDRQLDRFHAEALVTARLDHPHIVPVYAVGCQAGVHFYAMKYIEGNSVAEQINELRRSATLPSSRDFFYRAAQLGKQAAEALHFAHSQDIVHGDVKPANLLVDNTECLWLTDFGSARLTSASLKDASLASAGTLRYMSPEQTGKSVAPIDHRSDVYSLGATLFELVTLRPAIVGESSTVVLSQIALSTIPRPTTLNASVPTELEAIICHAMAANPQARYATAGELADDLRRFLDGQPVAAKIAPQRERPRQLPLRRTALLTAAVTLVVGLGSLVYSSRSTSQPTIAPRETDAEPALEQQARPLFQFPAAIAMLATAELYAECGLIEQAKGKSAEAIVQFEALHQSDLENSEYTIGLADAHTRVGAMLVHVLPPQEIEQHHRRAVLLLEPLAESPKTWSASPLFPFRDCRDALAECRVNLASALTSTADFETLFNSALAHLSDPAVLESAGEWSMAMLARAKQQYGEGLDGLGRHADAERNLLESIGLYEQLTSDFPKIVAYRFGLATSTSLLGEAFGSSGKTSEASAQYQRAIELLRQLTNDYTWRADFQHRLAGTLNNSVGKLPVAEAIPLYDEALQHELIAVRINPEHRQYRRWVAAQSGNLATRFAELGDHEKEEANLRMGIEHLQHNIEEGSWNYDDKHDLGHRWLALGSCLVEVDRHDESENAYRTATELFRGLIGQFGRKPHDSCMLAATFDKWSLLTEKRGDIDRARQYLQQAIANEEEALRSEPANAEHRTSLATYQKRLELLNQSPDEL